MFYSVVTNQFFFVIALVKKSNGRLRESFVFVSGAERGATCPQIENTDEWQTRQPSR